jgi:hypothetical protein
MRLLYSPKEIKMAKGETCVQVTAALLAKTPREPSSTRSSREINADALWVLSSFTDMVTWSEETELVTIAGLCAGCATQADFASSPMLLGRSCTTITWLESVRVEENKRNSGPSFEMSSETLLGGARRAKLISMADGAGYE